MCGIIGYSICRYTGSMQEFLYRGLIESETRGLDATGFVAFDGHSLLDDKRPIKATKFVKQSKAFKRINNFRPTTVIAHCRAATGGAKPERNRNNHPFIGDNIAIVHNGIIPNHSAWPSFAGLKFRTDTDSEVILRWLEDGIKIKESIFEAIKRFSVAVPNSASYAIAAMEKATGRLYLFRNSLRPMAIARVQNGIVFASTEDILKKALEKSGFGQNYILTELPPHEVFSFDTGTEVFKGKIFCSESKPVSNPIEHTSVNDSEQDDSTVVVPAEYADVVNMSRVINNEVTLEEVVCILNVMKKRMSNLES